MPHLAWLFLAIPIACTCSPCDQLLSCIGMPACAAGLVFGMLLLTRELWALRMFRDS